MWRKGQKDRVALLFFRQPAGFMQEFLVPFMDTIEIANGNDDGFSPFECR